VTQISSSGSVTQTTYDPTSGPASKAPRQGNYWDANEETDYYAVAPYIYATPNPQLAVGPDDIFTIVNRSVFHFFNPNALGNSAVSNPYNNPPTSRIYLDNWLGITDLNSLCVTTPRTNFTCVIDNTTARYDQLQGRYIFLFTVTDIPTHVSNFVLIVSRGAQFIQGTAGTSQLFTAPIAPITGGSNTGGVGTANWIRYFIPINVVLPGTSTAGTAFCTTPILGGNPASLPQFGTPASAYGPITSGCSNYFPTGARIGLDNDNILLTAPVLDMSQAPFSTTGSGGAGPFEDYFGNIPGPAATYPNPGTPTTSNEITLLPIIVGVQNLPQFPAGPYAGTRVVTVPKMIVYNGATLALFPTAGGALNLSDDTATGTLTGTWTTGVIPAPTCPPPPSGAVVTTPAQTVACNPNGTFTPSNLPARNAFLVAPQPTYLNSPPTGLPLITPPNTGATPWCGAPLVVPAAGGAPTSIAASTNCNPIPPIYWEPNNLRGRALASFDAQVDPLVTVLSGVVTPIDYLVGTLITDNFGTDAGAFTPLAYSQFFVQPVIFSCPTGPLFAPPSGASFCGITGGTAQVAEVAQLGVPNAGPLTPLTTCTASSTPGSAACQIPTFPRGNVGSIAVTNDPSLVGQGGSVTGGTNYRLFVGDQRPQQVIFREGLLYVARAVRLFDSLANPLGTSTVAYDIIRQPGPSCASSVLPALSNGNPLGNLCTIGTIGSGANPYSVNGIDIPQGSLVLETYWYNGQNTYDPTNNATGYGFWGPMFDVPANVINQSELTASNTPLTGSSPISPINVFPWLEKLFVSMTTGMTTNLIGTFGNNRPSLWDFRPGDDVFDTPGTYLDPYTGVVINSVTNTQACPTGSALLAIPGTTNPVVNGCPIVPFGPRGSAQTDPNDGSLWLYGEFAKLRDGFIPGPGHWGTSVANYQLDFPTTDPYGNDNTFFADVPPSNPYYTWIQIAKNVGIAGIANGSVTTTNCPPSAGTNPPILQPPAGGSGPVSGGINVTCLNFGPDVTVTRSEMARWIVLSQMDENMINTYLASTGGFPGCNGVASTTATPVGVTGSTVSCNNGTIAVPNTGGFTVSSVTVPNASPAAQSCTASTCTYPMLATSASFGDKPIGCSSTNTNCSYPGYLNDPNIRYIETLYRRGYTKGCNTTGDPIRKFCGDQFLTRAQMAVFVIRAKMNNVFPTTLSGINLCIAQPCTSTYGDNFGVFLPGTPYFPVDANGVNDPTYGDYYIFIQKMRELRITNGIGGGAYGSGTNITRKEVATFVVRAFFL
jgi:hypothetical protein